MAWASFSFSAFLVAFLVLVSLFTVGDVWKLVTSIGWVWTVGLEIGVLCFKLVISSVVEDMVIIMLEDMYLIKGEGMVLSVLSMVDDQNIWKIKC